MASPLLRENHGPGRTRTEHGTPRTEHGTTRAGRNPLAQLRGVEGPFGRFEKFCEVVAVVLPGPAYGEAAVGVQGVRIICSNRGILVMLGPFLPTRPFSRMLTAAAVVPRGWCSCPRPRRR
jgi:hypothetical protein